MTTWYVAPKGTVSGANNGTSASNAWNGINACRAGMGSTSAGDTIIFRGDLGPYGFADQADFAYAGTLSGAFSFVAGQSGPYIGNSTAAGSNASGRIFQFSSGAYGQAIIDMHRSDANHTASQRMYHALRIQGEGITVLNPYIIAPNFNYLPGIPGPGSQAEAMSQENYGLDLLGNGNTVDGGYFYGYVDTQGFCRAGLNMYVYPTGTLGLTTRVTNITTEGSHFGMQLAVQASTHYAGRAIVSNIKGSFPSWGSVQSTGRITGNAGTHGGHLSLGGQWDSIDVSNCTLNGVCQDAVDLITRYGTFRDSIITNAYAPSILAWTWDGSIWKLTNVVGVTGNGVKCGLNGYTGTSPSTWNGVDGTPGGNWNVDEFKNNVYRNKISNVMLGITTNAGNGIYIASNEISEAYVGAIYCNSSTSRANFWVENNYGKLASNPVQDAKALLVTANANIILRNNIFDCGVSGAARNVYDLHWLTALTPLSLNKNLYVNGTILQTQVYPGTGDITPVNPQWIPTYGLSSSSSLIQAGVHTLYKRDGFGKLFQNPPSVGPYEYIRTRGTRT